MCGANSLAWLQFCFSRGSCTALRSGVFITQDLVMDICVAAAIHETSMRCRLPDQAINVTVDPLNFALVHALAKFLGELAPGWKLGRGRFVQWPPCVRLLAVGDDRSRIFDSDYVLG